MNYTSAIDRFITEIDAGLRKQFGGNPLPAKILGWPKKIFRVGHADHTLEEFQKLYDCSEEEVAALAALEVGESLEHIISNSDSDTEKWGEDVVRVERTA